jgi:uncharacterized protein (DUF1810 family)
MATHPHNNNPLDTFDLDRFVRAQDIGGDYAQALAELRRGRKTSHWMWFVFPQIEGLGRSAMAQRYAISSLAEAQAYLAHPVLGPRLTEVSGVLLELNTRSAESVFGSIDATKLRSSMTLFDRAVSGDASSDASLADGASVFRRVLDQYFDGEQDAVTLARI